MEPTVWAPPVEPEPGERVRVWWAGPTSVAAGAAALGAALVVERSTASGRRRVTARSGSHSCSGWSEPDWGSRRQPRTSETANRCALSRRVVAALLGAWYAFAAVFLLAGIWVMRTVATDIGATQEIYDYMNAVEDEAGSGGTQHDADVLRAAYVASRENGRVSHTLTLANGTDILDASDDEWQRSRRRFELERNSGRVSA